MSTQTTTPADHKAELADKALDAYEMATARARAAIALSPNGIPVTAEMVKARIRQRQCQLHRDLTRISAVLGRLEGPHCRNGGNL